MGLHARVQGQAAASEGLGLHQALSVVGVLVGIVVDGGRVAQFPAAEAPGPPAAAAAAPAAGASAPSATAGAAAGAAAAAAPPTGVQLRLLLRQHAEALLAACAADAGALGLLRVSNPPLGGAVSDALKERGETAGGPPGAGFHEGQSEGPALKRVLDILQEEYESRLKVRRRTSPAAAAAASRVYTPPSAAAAASRARLFRPKRRDGSGCCRCSRILCLVGRSSFCWIS